MFDVKIVAIRQKYVWYKFREFDWIGPSTNDEFL